MLRIFSATAIVLLATSAIAGQKPNPPQIQYAAPINRGLVGAWLMTEGGGTTLYDASGRKASLAFSGSPSWAAGKDGVAVQLHSATTDYVVGVASAIPVGKADFSRRQ